MLGTEPGDRLVGGLVLLACFFFRFFRLPSWDWPILALACFSSTLRFARNHDGVRYPVTICFASLLLSAVSWVIIAFLVPEEAV
jgi:hypothetical protein